MWIKTHFGYINFNKARKVLQRKDMLEREWKSAMSSLIPHRYYIKGVPGRIPSSMILEMGDTLIVSV